MVSGVVPNVQAALIGCLLMGAAAAASTSTAPIARSSWKSLILIVGMLPFSLALQRTGGVDLAADALMRWSAAPAPRVVLASLFAITAVLGLFISNTATAVLMAPVALAIAKDLGASPYPFAMIVALAASAAFMTPISSPVNTLVVGPGQLRVRRFRPGRRAVHAGCAGRHRAAHPDFPALPVVPPCDLTRPHRIRRQELKGLCASRRGRPLQSAQAAPEPRARHTTFVRAQPIRERRLRRISRRKSVQPAAAVVQNWILRIGP